MGNLLAITQTLGHSARSVLRAPILVAGAAILGSACAQRAGEQDWESLLDQIRQRFPAVRQLSTSDLASWLQDADKEPPILVDARSLEEFRVSHLHEARHIEAASEAAKKLPAGAEIKPIVVYCSVGYRSSALAEALQKAGYERVYNLEGSIFKWANEGRPIFRGERPVPEVHPYDEAWGRFLERPYHHSPGKERDGRL